MSLKCVYLYSTTLESLPKSTILENCREYGKFNRFLDTISNRIKQNEIQRKSFHTYMNLFPNALIKKLRTADKLFDKMYSNHIMSGNYFDAPIDLNYDEYNLIVSLKLPFDSATTVNVTQSRNKCGYCILNINNADDDQLAQEFKTKFVNKENLLRTNVFYEWFNRIVSEHFTSTENKLEIVKKNNENVTFVIKCLDKSYTGILIKIYVPSANIRFSVDIGLGIEFDRSYAYCNDKIPQFICTENWMAIAKYDSHLDSVEWLCSFYTIERKMLQEKCKVVPLIRIFKQFFNAAESPNYTTYLIENIFLWEIAKQEDAKQTEFWTSSLASLFLHMYDVILRCLDKQSILYFWDESKNLLDNIDTKPMHDTMFRQKVILETELANGDTSDSESNFETIFYHSPESETNADAIQEIVDNLELTSHHNDDITENKMESIDAVNREANDFLTFLGVSREKKIDTPDKVQNVCEQSLSRTSSTITNSEMTKKSKKGLQASQVLELIGNFIQISDRNDYIQHYDAIIKFFVDELKTDDIFKHIFKGKEMAGSYRDGLKITKPNEYDTILRLQFCGKSNLIVRRIPDEPTHCTIQMKQCDFKAKPYLKMFVDSELYLLQDVIIIWIQNLFHRILKPYDENGKKIQIGNHTYKYSLSVKGVAFTFKIDVLDTEIKFNMDLVPAIPFDFNHWIATRDYPKENNQVNWIVVAKPPKAGILRPNRSFTCSYSEMEKFILHDANQAKNFIRIFKKLRDTQKLNDLKSYLIKTIFLWQFDNTTIMERKAFWSRSLDVIFLDMFEIVWKHIQKRELFFYWEPSYNKFSTIDETKLKSWEDTLRGINSRLNTIMAVNPKGLIDIILTPEEKELLERKHSKILLNHPSLQA